MVVVPMSTRTASAIRDEGESGVRERPSMDSVSFSRETVTVFWGTIEQSKEYCLPLHNLAPWQLQGRV